MIERLESALKLTDEQKAKVKPIFDKTLPQLQEIRQEAANKSKGVIENARNDLKSILTPEQEKQLDQIQQRLHVFPGSPQQNPPPAGAPPAGQ